MQRNTLSLLHLASVFCLKGGGNGIKPLPWLEAGGQGMSASSVAVGLENANIRLPR